MSQRYSPSNRTSRLSGGDVYIAGDISVISVTGIPLQFKNHCNRFFARVPGKYQTPVYIFNWQPVPSIQDVFRVKIEGIKASYPLLMTHQVERIISVINIRVAHQELCSLPLLLLFPDPWRLPTEARLLLVVRLCLWPSGAWKGKKGSGASYIVCFNVRAQQEYFSRSLEWSAHEQVWTYPEGLTRGCSLCQVARG